MSKWEQEIVDYYGQISFDLPIDEDIVTLLTEFLMKKGASFDQARDTIESMVSKQKTREQLEEHALTLPGVKDRIMCPLFDPEKSDTEEAHALACKGGQTDLFRVIMHLNDHHKWSREQIADWIEQEHSAGHINVAFEEKLFANRKVTE